MCWLKNSVPPREQDNCCVSGVRGAGVIEPRNKAVETSIDRFGGDYKNFELNARDGDDACKAACTADKQCRAWTYARPGYAGKDADCFLKKDIKPPRRKAGLRRVWCGSLLNAALSPPSLRGANGSRERAPDDRLRDEAIQLSYRDAGTLDCFASLAKTVWRHHVPLPAPSPPATAPSSAPPCQHNSPPKNSAPDSAARSCRPHHRIHPAHTRHNHLSSA